ncbi:STAS-like domain-containing protein [Saccharibacillus alkalitolerans]|uniref:STAS-like domain-containing protein n=1 Tax=Saccharibacillus alkalitolerans TaxID=2705290 RepID=A0ABX0FBG1_9BACL|nr:STAS-like domain-containing protein [Saccharibacillus alkalitolerans]NGZ77710.1 STAS-like domain-containing protein [Saccharibacillus alkalitolerans]
MYTISIPQMNHPRHVSSFLRQIINNKGKEVYVDLSKVQSAFPNVCVPISGMIQYYQEEGITFKFSDVYPDYLNQAHFFKPLAVKENIIQLKRKCLDQIWMFSSSEDVNEIVNAFVNEISQSIVCEQGVVDGLTWCINEVMDNVLQHSKVTDGFIMGQIHKNTKHIAICIFDYGQGIFNSLYNTKYSTRNAGDAITQAIKEGITRDKKIGQGNGLWGLHNIVQSNSGQLFITSDKASYMLRKNQIDIFTKVPKISQEKGCTIVDFQIDTDKTISVVDSLGGYNQPINLHIENLEDDNGNLNYKLSEKSSGTGTRQSGERIRIEILNIYNETSKPIIINFDGISVISSSFADELVGKLVIHFGFYNFTQIIRMRNTNSVIQAIIDRSVKQRISESIGKDF